MRIEDRIAQELDVPSRKVIAAVTLLDEGHTVPFIARYRKEATGDLDDIQLRALEARLRVLRALEAERSRVIDAIREQGKLTPALEQQLLDADTLARVSDLWLPFRPKRRTRAQRAIEAGLEPLAEALLAHPERAPEAQAAAFVSPKPEDPELDVPDVDAALTGARDILMQRFAEDPDLVAACREHLRRHGHLRAQVREGKEQEGAKFRDWFDFAEPLERVPSHRAMAMLRGQSEDILSLSLIDPQDPEDGPAYGERLLRRRFGLSDQGRPGDRWLATAGRLAWKVKLSIRVEVSLITELRARAEAEAIDVFAANLRDLLLAAPAGPRVVLGLDPGLRTGVKVAVVDHTGKLLETATIYPHPPKRDWRGAQAALRQLIERHGVELISIGNGTGSRETDKLAAELMAELPPETRRRLTKVVVNEAGASVYSASELASQEMPDVDVSLRGAASIARRLQDPLAELVKIEPRSIGVGQYQHDVSAMDLAQALDAVVEDCVNAVGVDLNTASPALLQRVAGLTPSLARAVVDWRDEHGAFRDRSQLLKVHRLGPRTFEECAGFLRIQGGDNPLDASAVHPEAYPVVRRIQAKTGLQLGELMGNPRVLSGLRPSEFTDERFGLPTVRDILAELEKPGRDPRPEFVVARLKEGVETLSDLTPGMVLEGTVTNVTGFGAFVDVGVHQDGLIHVSQLADRFVEDPRQVVRAGQVVTVRVLEVDLQRKRASLTMRTDAPKAERGDGDGGGGGQGRGGTGRGGSGRGGQGRGGQGRGDNHGRSNQGHSNQGHSNQGHSNQGRRDDRSGQRGQPGPRQEEPSFGSIGDVMGELLRKKRR